MSRGTVFVAGAAGAIGRVLVRLLVGDGWRVVGTTRSPERARALESAGVEPVLVDVFDAEAVRRSVAAARPVAVIHQLTDLPQKIDPATLAVALERNARLRETGTRTLVDACAGLEVRRFVCQSIAFAYAPGEGARREDDPLNARAADPVAARSAGAVAAMESLVLGGPFEGIVLRYGELYGPGTWTETPPVRCPVHVDAATNAARLALTRGAPGVYNVAEPGGTVVVTKAIEELGWDPDFRVA